MKKYYLAFILSVLAANPAPAALVKEVNGDINFTAQDGSNLVFTAGRAAYVNGVRVAECPPGAVIRKSAGAASVKCINNAVKIMDGRGNELRIAAGAVKGLNANGQYEALVAAETSVIARQPGAASVEVYDYNQTIRDLGVKKQGNNLVLDMSSDILFEFGKWDLTAKANETLNRLAYVINHDRKGAVLIQGHTDSVGDDAANLTLSNKRANTVAEWLITHGGIDANVLRVQGLGESYPVAANANPDGSDNPIGRAQNRRVSILIQTVNEPLAVEGAVGGGATTVRTGGIKVQTDGRGGASVQMPGISVHSH